MPKNRVEIRHKGVIREITETSYRISVERQAACQGCAAKKFCNLSDDDNELLRIKRYPRQSYNINDEVTVLMSEEMGRTAVLLGYFLPFVVLISGIIIPVLLNVSQGISGVIGLSAVVAYYLVLSLFRKRLNKKFVFRIE
ncbi:MAG: SoxR reducing system RseC family protein [Bacteroidales bacterium]|jgi:sigma-E factor negative regulatory protein RseC|nr:SoxR reducing system RseC family protein [Bacteroidales bacterium]